MAKVTAAAAAKDSDLGEDLVQDALPANQHRQQVATYLTYPTPPVVPPPQV